MRVLVATQKFACRSTDLLKSRPYLRKKWEKVIILLEKDIFDPRLKTHKLHGKMMKHIDQYACTLDYDIRILFTFDSKKVYLREIGTHNELYY